MYNLNPHNASLVILECGRFTSRDDTAVNVIIFLISKFIFKLEEVHNLLRILVTPSDIFTFPLALKSTQYVLFFNILFLQPYYVLS